MVRDIIANDTGNNNKLENKSNPLLELVRKEVNITVPELESGCSINEDSIITNNDTTKKVNVVICNDDKTSAITNIDKDGKSVVVCDDDKNDAIASNDEDEKGNAIINTDEKIESDEKGNSYEINDINKVAEIERHEVIAQRNNGKR